LQQTGVSARQRVNEHFSKHAVIPRYMDCYLAVGRQGEGGASHGRRL
jgi:hypothetical protein